MYAKWKSPSKALKPLPIRYFTTLFVYAIDVSIRSAISKFEKEEATYSSNPV